MHTSLGHNRPLLGGLSRIGSSLQELLVSLQNLDHLLQRAVAAAQNAYGPAAGADAYRGLYINQEEAERLLSRKPGVPVLWSEAEETEETITQPQRENSRLAWLKEAFDLSAFDIDVILIALAPELDLRYERLFAFLQDDITKRRPTVDLALNLLCPNAGTKLIQRSRFETTGPLIRHGFLQLIPDSNQIQAPLLAHYLKLDDQIVRLLLEQAGEDRRLASFCQVITPTIVLEELPLRPEIKQALPAVVSQARDAGQQLTLYFYGRRGSGRRRTAEALAGELGITLLAVELARAPVTIPDLEQALKLMLREAWLRDSLLYVDGLEALRDNERNNLQHHCLLAAMAEAASVTVLAGAKPWVPSGQGITGVITVPFPTPDLDLRRECWRSKLIAENIVFEPHEVDALSDRFRLTHEQIADALATGRNYALWRSAAQGGEGWMGEAQPTISDMFAAARAQSGHDLATLARKIEPIYKWDDIVLPADALSQLAEICQQVVHRDQVLTQWGFGRRLSLGKGVNALFAGPSGTGKTMAAEIIANELGLDLYKIDLSGVISKYIGETEKNLDRIFTAAEDADAILFFDEADALFGKRSEVRDSHDRYANIEIAYLLQKMEQYDGIAILATNMRQNMDEAFIRRLQFIVEFPFPDEANRSRIWRIHFPEETPRDEAIDFAFLARQFRIAGGNIKNIVLAAAFLAAAQGSPVKMVHLIQATRREHQKLGKALTQAELGPYAPEAGP